MWCHIGVYDMPKTRKHKTRVKEIYGLLKRDTTDTKPVHVVRHIRNYLGSTGLLSYTSPFPKFEDLEILTAYIPGGLRFGARYPDIIINSYDFVRASQTLNNWKALSVDAVVDMTYKMLRIDELVPTDFRYYNIPPWNRRKDYDVMPFLKAEECFDRQVFRCETLKQCQRQKQKFSKSLTNITALSFSIGDCREYAWLTGFFCHVLNQDPTVHYRICYATLYIIMDGSGDIYEFMDHVFTLRFKNDVITVIDALRHPGENTIVLHNERVRFIDDSVFHKCDIYKKETIDIKKRIQNKPIMEFGKLFVGGEEKHRLVAVPQFYDGSLRFIREPLMNPENVLLFNREMPYTSGSVWVNAADWCEI